MFNRLQQHIYRSDTCTCEYNIIIFTDYTDDCCIVQSHKWGYLGINRIHFPSDDLPVYAYFLPRIYIYLIYILFLVIICLCVL